MPTIVNRSARIALNRFVIVACLVFAVLAPAGGVLAQGTMGALPDPITSRELDDYARRMGLSPQQRAALEGFHADYRDQFALLRQNEIERYLSGAGTAGRGGAGGMGGRGMGIGMLMGNTDRRAIEANLRELKTINDRIRTLDTIFFDQIQALLTEEQASQLNSIRLARERARYRTGLGRMAAFTNPATQVDLTELLGGINLTPDERAGVTPLLAAYEVNLTSAVKRLHDDAAESTVQMVDRLEKLGFSAADMQDNRRRGEMFEAFRTVWTEITTKLNERGAAISDLNRRTERTLSATLSENNGRRLRDSFYRRAYPEIRSAGTLARTVDVVLEFDDLSQDQRASVEALYNQYLAQIDRLNEQMADAIDAQRRTQTGMDFGGGRGGQGGPGGRGGQGGQGGQGGGRGGNQSSNNEEQINRLRDQREQLAQNTRMQIESVIGPEMVERVQERFARNRDRGREDARGQGRGERPVTVAVAPQIGGGAAMTFEARVVDGDGRTFELVNPRDAFVPVAITERELRDYARRLGLDEESRTILTSLYDEYLHRYEEIDDTLIQAVRDAEQSLWRRGGENQGRGGFTPPAPEAVDRVYAHRRAAIDAVKALDDQFFNDIEIALLSDEMRPSLQRVRQARLRSIYTGGNNTSARGPQNADNARGDRGDGPQAAMMPRINAMIGGGITTALGGSGESQVDLSSVIDQARLDPQVITAIDPILRDYEVQATAGFALMFETTMKMRQASERIAGQFMRGGGQGGPGGGRGGEMNFNANMDEIRRVMDSDARAAREAAQAMSTLNRQTMERLVAQTDPSTAGAIRTAYNRRAFPDIYRDWRAAQPRLEAAMNLPDITDQQRTVLQSMTIEYRNAYDALTEQLVELERSGAAMGFTGTMPAAADFQAMQERMRTRERLNFERNDLNERTLSRLRAMLTEDQLQRVGLGQGGQGGQGRRGSS